MTVINFVMCFIVLPCIIFIGYYTIKMSNPYKLYMIFGKKGSGKSTYMSILAKQYRDKGWHVFSNTDIAYATKINIKELGNVVTPDHSCLLIDEVGMIWDNRNFKNFKEEVRDFFKLQRHYRTVVYLFSQTFDIDLKLRVLTDAMYMVSNPLPPVSILRKIKRTLCIVQPSADAEGRIADSLEFVPIWMSIFGAQSIKLIWLPKWFKLFDSFENNEFLPRFEDNYISKLKQKEINQSFLCVPVENEYMKRIFYG